MTARTKEAHDRILDASEELFFTFGYRRVTTDDIANAASASKRTLYALFPSKQAILRMLFLRAARDILSASNQVQHGHTHHEFADEMEKFLMGVVDVCNRFSSIMIDDLRTEHPAYYRRVLHWVGPTVRHQLHTLLETGKARGIVRPLLNTDATVHILWVAIFAALHRSHTRNIRELDPLPPYALCQIFLHGIARRNLVSAA